MTTSVNQRDIARMLDIPLASSSYQGLLKNAARFIKVIGDEEKTAFNSKPKTIAWAKKTSHGIEFSPIEISKLEHDRGFTWIEEMIVTEKLEQQISQEQARQPININNIRGLLILEYYLNHLENVNAKLALLDMGEIGLSTLSQETINEGTIVGVYAGHFKIDPKDADEQDTSYSLAKYDYHYSYHTDALCAGNITRFIPHLITQNELDQADLPGIDKSQIAVENLKVHDVNVAGKNVCAFTANQRIPAKTLVGYSYCKSYWKENPFYLFDKNGERAALAQYDKKGRIVLAPKQAQRVDSDASPTSTLTR